MRSSVQSIPPLALKGSSRFNNNNNRQPGVWQAEFQLLLTNSKPPELSKELLPCDSAGTILPTACTRWLLLERPGLPASAICQVSCNTRGKGTKIWACKLLAPWSEGLQGAQAADLVLATEVPSVGALRRGIRVAIISRGEMPGPQQMEHRQLGAQ